MTNSPHPHDDDPSFGNRPGWLRRLPRLLLPGTAVVLDTVSYAAHVTGHEEISEAARAAAIVVRAATLGGRGGRPGPA